MSTLKLAIDTEGIVTAIYSEELTPLMDAGEAFIVRQSNVDPTNSPEGVPTWWADMNDGAQLGPFKTRGEALAAEVAYLDHKLF